MRRKSKWEQLGKVLAIVGVLVLALLVFLSERAEKQEALPEPSEPVTTLMPTELPELTEAPDEVIVTPETTERPEEPTAVPESTEVSEPIAAPEEEGETEEVIELPFVPAG